MSRDIRLDLARCLWLGGDKKGAYTRLDNPFRSVLRQLGCEEEDLRERERRMMSSTFQQTLLPPDLSLSSLLISQRYVEALAWYQKLPPAWAERPAAH